MSKQLKVIIRKDLGENLNPDQVVDYLVKNGLTNGTLINSYEIKKEYEELKRKHPKKIDSKHIYELAVKYSTSYSRVYKIVKNYY